MRKYTIGAKALVAGGLLLAAVAGCQDGSGTAAGGVAKPGVPSFDSSTAAAPTVPSPSDVAAPVTTTEAPVQQPPDTSQAAQDPADSPTGTDCKAADLALSVADGDAGGGTVYRSLVFANAGGRTCTIQGFPGVSYVTGDDGHQVGPAAYRVGAKGAVVTLAPGGTAVADLGFVNVRNFDPAVCQPTDVRGLRIYPPHDTASMFVALPGTGCTGTPPGNQLTVKTVHP